MGPLRMPSGSKRWGTEVEAWLVPFTTLPRSTPIPHIPEGGWVRGEREREGEVSRKGSCFGLRCMALSR